MTVPLQAKLSYAGVDLATRNDLYATLIDNKDWSVVRESIVHYQYMHHGWNQRVGAWIREAKIFMKAYLEGTPCYGNLMRLSYPANPVET